MRQLTLRVHYSYVPRMQKVVSVYAHSGWIDTLIAHSDQAL